MVRAVPGAQLSSCWPAPGLATHTPMVGQCLDAAGVVIKNVPMVGTAVAIRGNLGMKSRWKLFLGCVCVCVHVPDQSVL